MPKLRAEFWTTFYAKGVEAISLTYAIKSLQFFKGYLRNKNYNSQVENRNTDTAAYQ
jgi:hypothetical protein